MFWIYRPVQAAFHRPWVSLRNFGSTRFLGMGYIIWWRPTELSPSRSCCFSKICSYLYACTMSAKFGAQKRGYVPLKHAYTLWIVRMALPLRRIQCPTSQHHCCPATVFRTWWRPIGMCEAYPGIVRESWQNLDKHVIHVKLKWAIVEDGSPIPNGRPGWTLGETVLRVRSTSWVHVMSRVFTYEQNNDLERTTKERRSARRRKDRSWPKLINWPHFPGRSARDC